MFVLVHMKDTIAVHPSAFSRDIRDALVEEIEGKYANKVRRRLRAASPRRPGLPALVRSTREGVLDCVPPPVASLDAA